MSDENDPVGYRKPPKAGQFKKGQSGNPHGRPRKPKPPAEIPASRHPTREYIRMEAERKLAISDASGRTEITARQAVIRSTYLKGAQGGPMAQRTAVQLMAAEDELYHRDRKDIFEYWSAHKAEGSARLAAAIKAGQPPPEILPHPDDVELDFHPLEVKMLGAMNLKERELEHRREVIQALSYEAWFFHEAERPDSELEALKGMNLYLCMYECARGILPPRLRRPPESFDKHLLNRASQGRRAWRADLERRCDEAEFGFIEFPPDAVIPWETLKRAGFLLSTPVFEAQPRGAGRPKGRGPKRRGPEKT